MNQLRAGIFLSYAYLFLHTIIGLVYTPFMLRTMGQNEFGLYSLAASVISYLTLFDFGLGSAVVRFTAKYRAEGKRHLQYGMFGMFLLLYCIISILTLFTGFLIYSQAEALFGESMTVVELSRVKIIIALLIANLAITFPFSIFGAIITAYEDFVFQRLIGILRVILQTAIMIPLLIWGYKAVALSVLITILNIGVLLINTIYCFKKIKIKINFRNMPWGLLATISSFSFYIFLTAIMDKFYWSSGQFILGHTSGLRATAVFAVAITIVSFYMAISSAIPGVLLPKITSMVTRNIATNKISELFVKAGKIQFMIIGFILSGFICFGKKFIYLWAGESYEDSYWICIILMFSLLTPLIQNTGIEILKARNQLRFRSITIIILSIIGFIISYWGAKKFGTIGCSLGIAMSLIVGNGIIINIYYWKCIHLNIAFFWKEILRLSWPLTVIVVIFYNITKIFPDESLIVYFIKIIAFSLLYGLILWFGVINSEKKAFIYGAIQKFLSRGRSL